VNLIDAGIVIIFLFFIVTGFTNGFVRELIALAAAILGVVLAGMFYDDVADKLLGSIDNETAKASLGFLIIFLGVTIIGQLLAFLVQPAMMILQLGIADQLLGAFFGALKAFVIIEAILILMVTYPRYDMDERINDSEFGSRMLEMADPILRILPDEFEARVNQFTGGILDLDE
jgi:membrane protein required for colicin V production